jgi:hypothetical protein
LRCKMAAADPSSIGSSSARDAGWRSTTADAK